MPGRVAGGAGRGVSEPAHDIPISDDDIDVLMHELSRTFNTEERATSFLRAVRFPGDLVPGWRSNAFDFWSTIFYEISRGAEMARPYRRLIDAALRVYGGNAVLESLQDRYQDESEQTAPPVEEPPARAPEPTCHLVLRIESEDERSAIEAWLHSAGLDPQEEWSTMTAVSFRLNRANADVVRATMRTRPDIGWTVVPPGQPDYLLRQIFVEGPDGRSFRFGDVPASSTVGSVAQEMVEQYPEDMPGRDAPTVVDVVGTDGAARRANPDNTLHDEGVTDGSRMRVGFQRRAAAPNPLDRRDALFGVRNQLQDYIDRHPDFKVWPNSPALPTEYEIEFTAAGFGPPAIPGEQPPEISVHNLSIVLGPDFPITAPRVRWLSDVYHPNVFPTYECEKLTAKPWLRGLVCLGTQAEVYQPSLEFGELCATLQDIAGYRNYSVFVMTEDVVDPETGRPTLRGDYFDEDAARWAISSAGQARIAAIGGAPVLTLLSEKPAHYGFEIEPDV